MECGDFDGLTGQSPFLRSSDELVQRFDKMLDVAGQPEENQVSFCKTCLEKCARLRQPHVKLLKPTILNLYELMQF